MARGLNGLGLAAHFPAAIGAVDDLVIGTVLGAGSGIFILLNGRLQIRMLAIGHIQRDHAAYQTLTGRGAVLVLAYAVTEADAAAVIGGGGKLLQCLGAGIPR